jgi:RimJ/RimL family protein N-acetyltransferase
MLRYLFEHTSLVRVYLNTLSWNHRAQRCFEKAGFRRIGRSSRNGHDFEIMEVRRENWLWEETQGRFSASG